MNTIPFRNDTEATAALAQIVVHLQAGGLLAYPTETVYGLGSRPLAPEVRALAALKGRAEGKPFLLIVSGQDMAEG